MLKKIGRICEPSAFSNISSVICKWQKKAKFLSEAGSDPLHRTGLRRVRAPVPELLHEGDSAVRDGDYSALGRDAADRGVRNPMPVATAEIEPEFSKVSWKEGVLWGLYRQWCSFTARPLLVSLTHTLRIAETQRARYSVVKYVMIFRVASSIDETTCDTKNVLDCTTDYFCVDPS